MLAAAILAGAPLAPNPLSAAAPAQQTAPAAQTSPRPSDTLTKQLQSSNPKDRKKAAQQIAKNGSTSDIPALVGALRDPSLDVRREIVLALASFRTPQALEGLIQASRDTDEETRTYAVEGIIGYYTGQAPSAGFIAFFQKQYQKAKRRFSPDNTRVDPGTAVDPAAVSALEAVMLDTKFERAAREATRGLGILDAKLAVPDLVRTAHSPDEDLAREALNSLMKIKDTSAGPQLMNLLDSSDRNIQRDAAVTVGFLRTRQAVPKLQSLYTNAPDRGTQEAALKGLSYIGDPVSVPIFLKAIWDPDKKLRIYGAEGLGRAHDTQATSDLLKATVVEKNDDAKMAMEFGLVALGNFDYLGELINDLSSRSRGDVAQAYLAQLAQNSAFLPKLYPFLSSRDADVRSRLCTVLMYSGDKSSIEPLERATHDSDPDVAAQAIRALRAVRVRPSSQAADKGN
jgi:HEAT repeat protein